VGLTLNENATPINICNLSTSKMSKTWHLIQQGHKKKTQIKLLSSNINENKTEISKYYQVASRKELSL
jgi:hypothetical protein